VRAFAEAAAEVLDRRTRDVRTSVEAAHRREQESSSSADAPVKPGRSIVAAPRRGRRRWQIGVRLASDELETS
jgi:hypothetical protein